MEKLRLNIVFFILAYCLDATSASCILGVRGKSPTFLKRFGKKSLVLPPNFNSLTLQNGEKLIAQCNSGISLWSGYERLIDSKMSTVFSVSIQCDSNGNGFYEILEPTSYSQRLGFQSDRAIYIQCMQGNQQIFESNTALEGCEDFSSFGIGTVLRNNEQMAIAGICFDIDTLKTKYVKYLAHRSKNHFSFENKNKSSDDFITYLDTPMESLEIFLKDFNKESFDSSFNAKKNENPLLALHEYEFLNIIQDDRISEDIKEFSYLLNTVWWRNLRLGSWKYFLDALQTRTKEAKYIIYTGTSGNSTIPSPLDHKKTEPLIINEIFEVPEIIWAYVKPVKANKNDEFVVFAYNTPFYAADKETIHCKDICNEIEWLNNHTFGQIHLAPAFGVIHCCRAHEVASQLVVFPAVQAAPISSATEVPLIEEDKMKN